MPIGIAPSNDDKFRGVSEVSVEEPFDEEECVTPEVSLRPSGNLSHPRKGKYSRRYKNH